MLHELNSDAKQLSEHVGNTGPTERSGLNSLGSTKAAGGLSELFGFFLAFYFLVQ